MAKLGRKPRRGNSSLRWACDGAIVALVLSGASLFLPEPWGGLGLWSDPHLAVHSAAAIVTRIVVFGILGGMLGSLWGRWHRKHT
jgi:hypothetical protein